MPLKISQPRQSIGIATLKDKLYFSGGFVRGINTNVPSERVDVLDIPSNNWTSFHLPQARYNIQSIALNKYVLFIGGTVSGAAQHNWPSMDVLDTETAEITSIYLHNSAFRAFIIGTKAYIYSVSQSSSNYLFIFDPDADVPAERLTTINVRHQILSAANNETHIFFLSDATPRVQVLDLATGTSRPFERNVPFSEYVANIFIIGRDLIFIGTTRFKAVSLVNSIVQESSFTDVRSPVATAFINGEIYLLQSGSLSIFNGRDIVQYRIFNPFFGTLSAAVEHKGKIYFSGTFANQQESILTVDTKSLFAPIDGLTVNREPTQIAEKGFYFLFSGDGVRYYDIRNRILQYYQYNIGAPRNSRAFVVGNQLLFIVQREYFYHVFDFNTITWTRRTMPTIFENPINSIFTRGNLALMSVPGNSYLYNATSAEWTTILPRILAVYARFVGDYIVFAQGDLRIYDTLTKESTVIPVEFSTNNRLGMVVHEDTVFIAGGIDFQNQFSDTVLIYNTKTKELRTDRLSIPRSEVETLAIDKYVIFACGQGNVRAASTRVDIYNTETSQWVARDLSQNVLSSAVRLTAFRDSVIFARQDRIEMLHLSSWNLQILPIPYSTPSSQPNLVVGSKILFFSYSLNGGTISIYETSTALKAQFTVKAQRGNPQFLPTQNYVVVSSGNVVRVVEIPTMENTISDAELFIGQATNFTVNAQGRLLMPQWQHNGRNLQSNSAAPFTMQLANVTQAENEGLYSVEITDQCNQKMIQQAKLTVHGVPVITKNIKESIIMCHNTADISTTAIGVQVQFNWTIGTRHISTNDSHITVIGDDFECNTEHQLCVSALNPSGSDSSCDRVRIIDHDSVFYGPRPTSSQSTWFTGSTATLSVRLVESDCTEHTWLMNNVPIGVSGSDSSTLDVVINSSVTVNEYIVEAQCGSSTLRSHPYRFSSVSSWNLWAVTLVPIGCTIVIVGAIVLAVAMRRRMISGKEHELELENMLTQAKSEALKQEDGVPIVRSTTWQWIPGDEFTYKPIDKTHYIADCSSLSSLSKEAVKVSTWTQSEITFRLRDTKPKRKKKSFLKEQLIGGATIDIYPPQSPKYDVKIEPSSFSIESDEVIRVTVSSLLRMTTKCKICLMVVDEREKIYSAIEFKMSSTMSTWIDLDEVETSGEYLGGGG